MSDFLQTQKSFSYGQAGLSGFSNMGGNYLHSCKKLKNAIVNKNGSVRVRGGWQDVGTGIELDLKKISDSYKPRLARDLVVRDIFDIEGNYIYWLESGGGDLSEAGLTEAQIAARPDLQMNDRRGEGLYIYDASEENFEKMKFSYDRSHVYGEKLKDGQRFAGFDIPSNTVIFPTDEQFRQHGFDNFKPINIVNVLPFENFLYVFFENSFPYIVKADEGVVATAPYWQGVGANKIWKAFPFNYTAKRRTIGSYFYRQGRDEKNKPVFYPALNQEEKLRLKLSGVSINQQGTGECRAWIESTEGVGFDLYVDKAYASLQRFLGRPIAFQLGLKDLRVQKSITAQATEDFLDNFYDRTDTLEAECRRAGFSYNVSDLRLNLATIVAGWNTRASDVYVHYIGPRIGLTDAQFETKRETIEKYFESDVTRSVRNQLNLGTGGGPFSHNSRRALDRVFPSSKNFKGDREAYDKAVQSFYEENGRIEGEIAQQVLQIWKSKIKKTEASMNPLCQLKENFRGKDWQRQLTPVFAGLRFREKSSKNVVLTLSKKSDGQDVKVRLTQESIDGLFSGDFKNLSFNPLDQFGKVITTSKVYLTKASSRSFLRYLESEDETGSVRMITERKDFDPTGDDLSDVFAVDNPSNPTAVLPKTTLEGIDKKDTAQQVLVKNAYNFYVIFPYEIVNGVSDPKSTNPENFERGGFSGGAYAKCKIYEIGSQLSEILGPSLGEYFLETEDYILSDWVDGWPKSGDVLNDKYFFFTSKSKLSFSQTEKPYIWGNPIKSLLRGPTYNLMYQENVNRQNDEEADDNSSVRFQTLLREDFKYPTPAITEFFDEIDRGDTARELSVADPITYRIEDKNGLLVDVRRHHMVSVGVLTNAGIQCIFMSDKGVFYWGFTPSERNFLKLANVSNFIGGEDPEGHDFGLEEILSKMFTTSQDGELHMVNYDPNNRNFVAEPAGVDRGFRGFVHGVNFYGNRLLFIDRFSKKMYCCNVSNKGELMGVSEWGTKQWTPQGLWKFGNDYFAAFYRERKVKLMKYVDTEFYDYLPFSAESPGGITRIQEKNAVLAEVETAPITWIAKYGDNCSLHMKKTINRVFFWTDVNIFDDIPEGNIIVLKPHDLPPRLVNGKYVRPEDVQLVTWADRFKNTRNKGQDGILSFQKPMALGEGQGLRFLVAPPYTISGITMYCNSGN